MKEEDSPKNISNDIQREVEKALEQRTNLENLFSQKFSDLRSQLQKDIKSGEKDTDSRFREVKIYGTLGLILLALLGVIGYYVLLDKAGQFVTQQIDKKLIDPKLNKAVENLVATKIKPLEERVEHLNKDILAKQSELTDAQAQLRQALEIQQLSIGARAGSRNDYEKLLELSKSEEQEIRRNAEVAIQDLDYHFSADRASLSYQRLVDSKTYRKIFHSVEELAEQLGNKNAGMREGTVNLIAESKNNYFIGRLVQMLIEEPKEPNLRVCARITRALNMLTNERFDPLDFDAVASWWNQNNDKEEYVWPFDHYFVGIATMNSGNLDESLIHFERMIEREPEALHSMIYKAVILTKKGKYEEAEKVFKQVEDTRNDYRWLYVWRAFLFLKQNKQDEAVNSINRALEVSPGVEEIIRSQSWAQPLLSNKAIKWSNQETEVKNAEIQQD